MKYIIIVFVFLTLNSWAQKEGIVRINIAKEYKSQNLSYLKKAVGNAQIVMLGEPSHGEGNIFELKTQMVKYLIEEMGFEVIAFESPMYDLYKLNSNSILKSDIRNAILPIWSTKKEFQEFIDWSYSKKDKIKFAGFDCQFSELSIEHFLEDIEEFKYKLTNEDIEYLELELITLDSGTKEIRDLKRFNKLLNRIIKTTKLKKNEQNADFVRQMCKSLKAYAHYTLNVKPHLKTKETFKAKDNNARDKQMAENLLFLQKYYNKKIICWGANAHFAYDFKSFDEPQLREFIPMGYYIKKKLKDKVLNIGFTTYQGQYLNHKFKPITISTKDTSTYEYQLAKTHTHALIDIRDFKDTLALQNYCDYTKFKGVYSQAMDFIYFAKNSTLPKDASEMKEIEIRGVVLDKSTLKPIQFANVYPTKRLDLGTSTDSRGEYSIMIPEDILKDSLTVSLVGYKLNLSKIDSDTIFCEKDKYSLNEVKVQAKSISAKSILQKAITNTKHFLNKQAFNREYYKKVVTTNYQDTINFIEYLNEACLTKGFKKRKEIRICKQLNKQIHKKRSLHEASLGGFFYFLRPNYVNKKKCKKYQLSINYEKTDSLFYTINFYKKGRFRYTGFYPKGEIKGEITINKQDFAITKIQCISKRDTSWTNKYARKYDHPFWSEIMYQNIRKGIFIFSKLKDNYYNTFTYVEDIVKGHHEKTLKKFHRITKSETYLLNIKEYKKLIKPKKYFSFFYRKTYSKIFWKTFKRPQVLNKDILLKDIIQFKL